MAKIVFIRQEEGAEPETIDQAIVLVDDDFEEDDLLDDDRVSGVINSPAITLVVKIPDPLLNDLISEAGDNRPYFG